MTMVPLRKLYVRSPGLLISRGDSPIKMTGCSSYLLVVKICQLGALTYSECNFEVGENLYGVGKTHDGQTSSVTDKIGQTRDGYVRDTYVTFP